MGDPILQGRGLAKMVSAQARFQTNGFVQEWRQLNAVQGAQSYATYMAGQNAIAAAQLGALSVILDPADALQAQAQKAEASIRQLKAPPPVPDGYERPNGATAPVFHTPPVEQIVATFEAYDNALQAAESEEAPQAEGQVAALLMEAGSLTGHVPLESGPDFPNLTELMPRLTAMMQWTSTDKVFRNHAMELGSTLELAQGPLVRTGHAPLARAFEGYMDALKTYLRSDSMGPHGMPDPGGVAVVQQAVQSVRAALLASLQAQIRQNG